MYLLFGFDGECGEYVVIGVVFWNGGVVELGVVCIMEEIVIWMVIGVYVIDVEILGVDIGYGGGFGCCGFVIIGGCDCCWIVSG